jgi:hypothetical protein
VRRARTTQTVQRLAQCHSAPTNHISLVIHRLNDCQNSVSTLSIPYCVDDKPNDDDGERQRIKQKKGEKTKTKQKNNNECTVASSWRSFAIEFRTDCFCFFVKLRNCANKNQYFHKRVETNKVLTSVHHCRRLLRDLLSHQSMRLLRRLSSSMSLLRSSSSTTTLSVLLARFDNHT